MAAAMQILDTRDGQEVVSIVLDLYAKLVEAGCFGPYRLRFSSHMALRLAQPYTPITLAISLRARLMLIECIRSVDVDPKLNIPQVVMEEVPSIQIHEVP